MNRAVMTSLCLDVFFEKATPHDFLSVAALDCVVWQASAGGKYIPDGEHTWRIWCEHALTVVGKDSQGKVVAALLAFPCANQSYCLHKVMVAPSHQGQGMGAKLFDVLISELDRLGVDCFLTVSPSNTRALKLYRRYGFTKENFVQGFYRPEEDRLILIRQSVEMTTTR